MSYSSNPLLPKARADAVRLVVEDHLPISIAARKSGVHRTTLWRWHKRWKAREYTGHIRIISTRSSRPHSHPRAVTNVVIARIRHYRTKYGRCATITHAYCLREGTAVSLSTVRRVLHRLGLVASRTKWKRHNKPRIQRPRADTPGALVQTDVVHLTSPLHKYRRSYLYTAIDLHTRWAYAEYHASIGGNKSVDFITRAQEAAGFHFSVVQADNGAEFGKIFEDGLSKHTIAVRHSRVRRPNDNAHVERFNRSIQEECVGTANPFSSDLQSKVQTYLAYYNNERLHLGIQCMTPSEVLQRF